MLIVNADDLGMTPGANQAIFDGCDAGAITHTSIMANADYVDEAITQLKERPVIGLGIHLNITYGKPLLVNPLYCNADGVFNLSYKTLLLRKDTLFLEAIEKEWEAQIHSIIESIDKKLTHIDSHRHVHLIPHLYPIVMKLAKQYTIPRVRLIKENIFHSLYVTRRFNFIANAGIVKYLLLRFFTFINQKHAALYTDMKFYSILYTGVIGKNVLASLQACDNTYEVMVHPSYPALDKEVTFYDEAEKTYRISPDRYQELQQVLSLKVTDD